MFRWLQTEGNLFAAESAARRDTQQGPGLMEIAGMMAPHRTEHTER